MNGAEGEKEVPRADRRLARGHVRPLGRVSGYCHLERHKHISASAPGRREEAGTAEQPRTPAIDREASRDPDREGERGRERGPLLWLRSVLQVQYGTAMDQTPPSLFTPLYPLLQTKMIVLFVEKYSFSGLWNRTPVCGLALCHRVF